jgi:type I restriction enzyme M protein
MPDHNYFSTLIWQIADLLRGPYRPPQYERVMLPMTVLRRFDSVLAPTKEKVLAEHARFRDKLKGEALDAKLNRVAGQRFHNHSPLDFEKLKGDPDNIAQHLVSYINGFSANVHQIFQYFEFENEIEKMREANILYLVVSNFSSVDLHPDHVQNEQMGLIFENLIRRFNELANETAGDHFTPREVIRLMVNILFIHDDKLLATPGTVRKMLDPACGTGGMLAEAQNYLRDHHGAAKLYVFGQDYNKRAFATAASDMLMKAVDQNGGSNNIRYGDTFTEDQFTSPPYDTFDYLIANPPFGVDWKKEQREVEREHEKLGYAGRFGAGLPRVNDGSLLFLQHMISKFELLRPAEQKYGSRLAIVFSGSPLFAGGAGSGESNIRKWIIENDWFIFGNLRQEVIDEILLSALAENDAVYRERAAQPVQTLNFAAERQGGQMALDFCFTGKRPVRYEVIFFYRAVRASKRKRCLPHIRIFLVQSQRRVCCRNVFPDGVSFVAIYPALALLQVHGVRRQVPVRDSVAVVMKIEALLPHRGRDKHERPER